MKPKKTLYALKQIRVFFDTNEFLDVINAMFYSKLFYASQVWLTFNLKQNIKTKLFSTSAKALKLVAGDDFNLFSFNELHILFSRATPLKYSMYTHAMQLYSILNEKTPNFLWLKLQMNFQINNRTDKFQFIENNTKRIGKNCFINRINDVCQHLKFSDFNLSKNSFKILCKKKFLSI